MRILFFLGAVLLWTLASVAVTRSQPDGKAGFTIKVKKADDGFKILSEKDKTIIVFQCPSGISSAIIERQDDNWPKTFVIQLDINGLERFKAHNGKYFLNASAGGAKGKIDIREWKDKDEKNGLDKKSPLWIDTQILDGEKPAKEFPLQNGHIHLTLPAAFFADNPKIITLEWIDFYR